MLGSFMTNILCLDIFIYILIFVILEFFCFYSFVQEKKNYQKFEDIYI